MCRREQDRRRLSSTDLPGLERGSYTDNLRLREEPLQLSEDVTGPHWQPGLTVCHWIPFPGPGSGLEEARDVPRAPLFKDLSETLGSLHPTPWHVFWMGQPPQFSSVQSLSRVRLFATP